MTTPRSFGTTEVLHDRVIDRLLSSGFEKHTPPDPLMDGAQLVRGEWYNPTYGCDSLDRVIDYIELLHEQVRVVVTQDTVGNFYSTNPAAHRAVQAGLTQRDFIRYLLGVNDELQCDLQKQICNSAPVSVVVPKQQPF